RFFHRAVVFNNRIYILAGYDGTSRRDVWWTTDGSGWTQSTAMAPWTGRASSTAVVFNSRIYIMGGFDFGASQFFNDVWYTENGSTWTRATESAGWPARDLHASVIYQNRLWVF